MGKRKREIELNENGVLANSFDKKYFDIDLQMMCDILDSMNILEIDYELRLFELEGLTDVERDYLLKLIENVILLKADLNEMIFDLKLLNEKLYYHIDYMVIKDEREL